MLNSTIFYLFISFWSHVLKNFSIYEPIGEGHFQQVVKVWNDFLILTTPMNYLSKYAK